LRKTPGKDITPSQDDRHQSDVSYSLAGEKSRKNLREIPIEDSLLQHTEYALLPTSTEEAMTETPLAQETVRAYVCLGSNGTQAADMLARARRRMERLPGVRPGAVSPVYLTEPQEYRQQAWFLNQVVELFPGDGWTALKLLKALLDIESELGRVRDSEAGRFGPRAVDADLLLYGNERSLCAECLLPHPRMARRAFVLVPLLDIAPDICIDGARATILLARLNYRIERRRIFQNS
jgi:2-amino-4-hydroxy-6-hydroxymethyldihydropteridine diphosphokinase